MMRLSWQRVGGWGFLVLTTGALAGGIAGWYSGHWSVRPEISGLQQVFQDQLTKIRPASPTSTATIEEIPVNPPLPASGYPDLFVTRSTSPVLKLIRRTATVKSEEGIVSPDRLIGAAVSLTADGWFVTPDATVAGLRLADLSVAWQGRTYPVLEGVRDAATGAVFLKAAITGLPVTNLVRASDVITGTGAWVEVLPHEIRPSMITSISERATTTERLSSEIATRRFALSTSVSGVSGGAVWNARGDLLGLVLKSVRPGEASRVLPANDLIQALQSLLSQREIRHASLGIRTVDLATVIFEDGRQPALTGAWIMPGTAAAPSIAPAAPAATMLQEGDVIDRIERDVLDGRADLGERLLDYRPGSAITLYGTRKGVPFQARVTLGSVVTSEVLK